MCWCQLRKQGLQIFQRTAETFFIEKQLPFSCRCHTTLINKSTRESLQLHIIGYTFYYSTKQVNSVISYIYITQISILAKVDVAKLIPKGPQPLINRTRAEIVQAINNSVATILPECPTTPC